MNNQTKGIISTMQCHSSDGIKHVITDDGIKTKVFSKVKTGGLIITPSNKATGTTWRK